jgi:hypothetical protein
MIRMAQKELNYQREEYPSDDSNDSLSDFSELIKERSFVGVFPLETILEGIRKQFEDYINLEDVTNYVEIFYKQLNDSFNRLRDDDSEEHPQEIKEVLDGYYNTFVDLIKSLFEDRLTIVIRDLETEEDDEEVEYVIKRLYEFFILGARRNFKTVISLSIISFMQKEYKDDEIFYQEINDQIDNYSPLISILSPEQFLNYCGDKEIIDIFKNDKASGNFLRKYSPKLYKNDDFLVDIINRITMLHQFKRDMVEIDYGESYKEELC